MATKKSEKSAGADDAKAKSEKTVQGRPATPRVAKGKLKVAPVTKIFAWVGGCIAAIVVLTFIIIQIRGLVREPKPEYLGYDRPSASEVPVIFERQMRVSVGDSVFWAPGVMLKEGDILTTSGDPLDAVTWKSELPKPHQYDTVVSTAGADWRVASLRKSRRREYPAKGNAAVAGLIGVVGSKHRRKEDGFPVVEGGSSYFYLGCDTQSVRIPCDGELFLTINEPLHWAERNDNGGIWNIHVMVQRAPTEVAEN